MILIGHVLVSILCTKGETQYIHFAEICTTTYDLVVKSVKSSDLAIYLKNEQAYHNKKKYRSFS